MKVVSRVASAIEATKNSNFFFLNISSDAADNENIVICSKDKSY